MMSQLKGKIKDSFAFPTVKASAMGDKNQPTYTLAATMRLERFFSSIWESSAPINDNARKMLEDQEYVNFFMACGPNYVRSFQRAQEVTGIIKFSSEDTTKVHQFANLVRLYVQGNQDVAALIFDNDQFADILSTIYIEIMGFGLGLNNDGQETLVATSFEEFNNVMSFAFDSMTKNNSTENTDAAMSGMISKMEVVPWSDNSELLNLAEIDFNSIFSPISSHLLPDAKMGVNEDGDEAMVCVNSLQTVDSFDKCCEEFEMIEVDDGVTMCKPQEYLPPITLKENMETNAEFVVWLNSVARHKSNRIDTLSQCVNKLRSFPPRNHYEFLEQSEKVSFDESIDMKYTVAEMNAYLNPTRDQSLLQVLAAETNEYMDMFYYPCLSSLYGRTLSDDNDMDPKYFMAQPWYNHADCAIPSCLEKDKAWNRQTGKGCIDGILSMTVLDEELIPSDNDPFCSQELALNNFNVKACKYKFDPELLIKMDQCRNFLPKGRDGRGRQITLPIGYVMDYYCLPQLSGIVADDTKKDEVDEALDTCVSGKSIV